MAQAAGSGNRIDRLHLGSDMDESINTRWVSPLTDAGWLKW